ncbi:hypothetical protein [Reinekea sp.]|jgi:hypothetical protein|uniref:hypothetical protein n=1 Tax=Reinekea sp. TaxID=1970455 RepID=UPI002A83FB72|nr:hypothetical protein [Reinekea sp.]
MKYKTLLLLILAAAQAPSALSWSNHTLISYDLLQALPEVRDAALVEVETIEAFLMATETELAAFLEEQEQQMRRSLWYYAPRPDTLRFTANGDEQSIRKRFTAAIRINPNSKLALYAQLLPGEARDGMPIDAHSVTTLADPVHLLEVQLIQLTEGLRVAPLDVVATANDEPDHGLDIGLFTDSNTDYGQQYGFGAQPFGNPALPYGTQAPFHMGFYHEPRIIYAAAGFLKRTYPEYRILLYKQLAEFAFAQGHDYWGWRFMGWGLHYVGDFSNPYHVTPLPGASTLDILVPGVLGVIGLPKGQQKATQLTSNRHTALEDFQQEVMDRAYSLHQPSPLISALVPPQTSAAFTNEQVVGLIAKTAYDKAEVVDRVLQQAMPAKFINDSAIEYSDLGVKSQLPDIVLQQSGPEAYQRMETLVADLLGDFAQFGTAYVRSILSQPRR